MPKIMGILNVTPDSFSDGGLYLEPEAAVSQARALIAAGADIIDVGAESTRPGAEPISLQEELDRLLPVLWALKKLKCPLSVDTYKPEVAEQVFKTGIDILNDVGGLHEAMQRVVRRHQWRNTYQVVLMHRGPATAKQLGSWFEKRLEELKEKGVENIILDPGFGFNKSPIENWGLINRIHEWRIDDLPVLLGFSRKSFHNGCRKFITRELIEMFLPQLNENDILRLHDPSLVP